MHADGIEQLLPPEEAFDLQPGVAEVNQQAEIQSSRLEIIQTLRTVDIIQRSDRFQLNQYSVLYQQVGSIFANNDTVVTHDDAVLLEHIQIGISKFVRKRIFIHFFQEASTERVLYTKRAADNTLG